MGFINFLPLLLLVFIPLVILLYLLKQKSEDFIVPSLFLWREAYKNIEASAPWEKLKRNLLMFLQILILLLLILAMTSPYLKGRGETDGHIVLAIDTSGSMNMVYDDSGSRFTEAIRQAGNYIDSCKTGTAFAILSVGRNAVIQGANITNKEEAKNILTNMKATDSQSDLEGGLNLISSMAGQWESYELLLFSDQPVDFQELNGRLIDVNSIVLNGCIDYISYAYADGEDRLSVLVRVSNPSPFLLTSDVNLYLDEHLVDIGFVSLAPGESEILYFEGVAADGRLLMAELNEGDGLRQDNQAYALIENGGPGDILLVSNGNLFLEKGISLLPDTTLYRTNNPDNIGPEDVFDLYIFDGMLPAVLPAQGNLIFLGIDEDGFDFIKLADTYENVYITTMAHETTRYLEDFTFGITKAHSYERPLWARNIFTREGGTIGFSGEYDSRIISVIGFDFHNSDFPLQMEFPIFIHNLVSQSLKQGLVLDSSFMAGSKVNLNPNISGGDIFIENPLGQQTVLPLSSFHGTYDELDYAGVYVFSQAVDGEILTGMGVAGFPTNTESVVREYEGLDGNSGLVPGTAGAMGRELRTALIIAALFILMAEWFIYLKDL